MTNKEAIKILQNDGCCQDCTFGGYPCKLVGCETHQALDLAIKALEKDKCSSCKHYDKDYGETCLNPEGTCRVFAYDGYEKGDRE